MVAHHHEGYWLDVSSLRNFYDVNLSLAGPAAPLSIEEIHKGIVSRGAPSCADLHLLCPKVSSSSRNIRLFGGGIDCRSREG